MIFDLSAVRGGVCHKLAVAVWQVQDAAQAAADEMRLGILRPPTVSVGSFAGSAKTCQEWQVFQKSLTANAKVLLHGVSSTASERFGRLHSVQPSQLG